MIIRQNDKCSDCDKGVMKRTHDYQSAEDGAPSPPEIRLRCNNPKCGVVKFLDGTKADGTERI